jgi:hypothetical protein
VEDQRNRGEDRQNLNCWCVVAFRVPMLQPCGTQRVIATEATAVS